MRFCASHEVCSIRHQGINAMAETATTTSSGDAPICPDPSVHEKSMRQSEAASSAALLATERTGKDGPLGSDGKLSSKSECAVMRSF